MTKEGLPAALLGNDRPGSTVSITVKREEANVRRLRAAGPLLGDSREAAGEGGRGRKGDWGGGVEGWGRGIIASTRLSAPV